MSQKLNTTSTIGWILFSIIAVTPLLKDSALEPYLIFRTLVWSVLASVGCVAVLAKSKGKIDFPLIGIVWIALVGWTLTGYSSALSTTEWWLTFSRYGLYAAILILTVTHAQTGKIRFIDLSKGLAVMGILTSIIVFSKLGAVSDVYEIHAPFGHKNFVSMALLVSLLGSLPVIRETHRPWRIVGIVSVILATVVIIILRTRGVWIAAILASVFMLLAIQVLRPKGLKETIIPLRYLGLGFGILLMGILAMFSLPKMEEKIFDSANIDVRLTYWNHSLEMFKEEPITGVGAGQWKIHFPKYGLEKMNTRVSNGETAVLRPHNDYLWMLSEGGLPTFLLYVTFWGWIVLTGVQKLRKESDPEKRMKLMSATAIIIAFLAYAMGEFPIERVDMAIPVLVASGFLIHDSKYRSIPIKALGGLALLLSLVSLYIAFGWFSSAKWVKDIAVGNDTRDVRRITTAYEAIDPSKVELDIYANPLAYFYGLASMAQGSSSNNTALMNRAKTSFDDALEIHPWHVVTMVSYGNWYKIQNNYTEAMAMYEKGLAISPYNIDLRLNRAEILLRTNDPHQSANVLLSFVGMMDHDKYKRLVVQSLRAIQAPGKIERVNDFFLQTDVSTLNDSQLVEAFVRYRDGIR